MLTVVAIHGIRSILPDYFPYDPPQQLDTAPASGISSPLLPDETGGMLFLLPQPTNKMVFGECDRINMSGRCAVVTMSMGKANPPNLTAPPILC